MMGILQIVLIANTVLSILGKLFPLVRQAEEEHGPGAGGRKHADVFNEITEPVDELIDTMVDISTGGQEETWAVIKSVRNPIMGLLGKLISFVAGGLFPKGTTTSNHEEEGP